MKKKILASVLMAIILSGCTMPEISFNNTGSPLFVEEKNESSASDVSGPAGSEHDGSEIENSGGTEEESALTDQSGTEIRNEDTSADLSGTGMSEDNSSEDLSGDTSVKDEKKKTEPAPGTKSAERISLVLAESADRKYDNASGKVSAEVIYTWPELTAAAKKKSPDLNRYLERYETALMKQMNTDFSELTEKVSESRGTGGAERTIARTMLPVRSDTNVFSAVTFVSGEKDGNSDIKIEAVNIDPETGKEIELSEVIDAEEIAGQLRKAYEAVYTDGPITDFEKTLSGYDVSDYVWAVSEEGINFYFADDTGSDPVTVQILRNKEPDLFTDYFAEVPKSCSVPVRAGVRNAFDIKNDGSTDLLKVSGGTNAITVEMNGRSAVGRLYSGEIIPVLVRTADERYYIYVHSAGEGEYDQLAVFDINGDIPVFLGTLPNAGFPKYFDDDGLRRMVLPSDPDEFLLRSRFDLLGSYSGSCLYGTGHDGMPEGKDTWYYLNGDDFAGSNIELTALMKFAADEIDPETDEIAEEGIIIQKGTPLKIYRTDGKSIVDMKTEDGSIVRVDVDTSGGWPQTIDGTSIQKLFDGISFAD